MSARVLSFADARIATMERSATTACAAMLDAHSSSSSNSNPDSGVDLDRDRDRDGDRDRDLDLDWNRDPACGVAVDLESDSCGAARPAPSFATLAKWVGIRIYPTGLITNARLSPEREIVPSVTERVHVRLSDASGKRSRILVAELVLLAFCGEQPGRRSITWKDGNYMNNCISNLAWSTKSWTRRVHRRHAQPPPTLDCIFAFLPAARDACAHATFASVPAAVAHVAARGHADATCDAIEACMRGPGRYFGGVPVYGYHWLRCAPTVDECVRAATIAHAIDEEEWKPVRGTLAELLVSNRGRVKRARDQHLVHAGNDVGAYVRLKAGARGDVRLSFYDAEINAVRRPCISTLVASEFHPNAATCADKMRVEHIDGDKENNQLANLRYV